MKKKKILSKCYDAVFALSDKKYFDYPGDFTYTKKRGINAVMLPVTKKVVKICYGNNSEQLHRFKLIEKHGGRKVFKVFLYLGEEYINHKYLSEIKEIIKNIFSEVE